MGGLTTLLAAFHPEFHDERIRAAAPIAPLSSFFMPEFYHTRSIPLLLVSGDQAAFIDYGLNARRSFERAAPNAQLVTLSKGSHAAFAFPLDSASLALMNTLLGPEDADPSNPDGFGCAQTGATLRADSDYLAPMGGKANFVDYDAVREPWLPSSGVPSTSGPPWMQKSKWSWGRRPWWPSSTRTLDVRPRSAATAALTSWERSRSTATCA